MLSVLISLFFLIGCSEENNKKKNCTDWVVNSGYVQGNTGNKFIYYNVNGRGYKTRFKLSLYGSVDDERYELKYCRSNPEIVEINYCKPVFLESEQTAMLTGKITRIFKYNIFPSRYRVSFEYYVKGYRVEKSQELPANYKELYPYMKAGEDFEVECLTSNARRSIIHLDKPIK